MEPQTESGNIIDATKIPPQERHFRIFEKILSLKPGEVLQVIAGHEPVHLLQHMAHEGIPVDQSAYYSRANPDGTYSGYFTRAQSKEDASRIKITSFESERNYSDRQFNPVGIYSGKDYKVVLTYLKAGQFIPVHSPSTDLVFAVFRGTGLGIFGDREEPLIPGTVVVIPGGKSRGIKAVTDLEGLHIVSPIPDESDHVEVFEKLSSGRFQ